MYVAQVLAQHPRKGYKPEHAAGQFAEQHVPGVTQADVCQFVLDNGTGIYVCGVENNPSHPTAWSLHAGIDYNVNVAWYAFYLYSFAPVNHQQQSGHLPEIAQPTDDETCKIDGYGDKNVGISFFTDW